MGQLKVAIALKHGKFAQATVRSLHGGHFRLRYGAATRDVQLKKGASLGWDGR